MVGHSTATCLPGLRHAERRADGNLGLSETDVAAHEPIHGARLFEVARDVGDGVRLVGRFVEREGGFECAVVVVDGGNRFARYGLSLGVEAQKLVGHLADLLFDSLFGLAERLAAQTIDLGRAFPSRPFLDLVQAVDGQVQLVAPRVFDDDEIHGAFADVLVQKALISADAVLDVDDVVADFERAEILEESLGGAFRPPFGAMSAAAEDFFFRDEDEVFGGRDDAAREGPHHDADLGAPPRIERLRIEWPGAERARDVAMTNERRQALGLRLAARAEKDGKPRFAPRHEPIDERVERAVFAPRSAGQGDRTLEVPLITSHQRRRVLGCKLETGEALLCGSAGDGCSMKREHRAPLHRLHDGRFFVVELRFGQMGRPALLDGVR